MGFPMVYDVTTLNEQPFWSIFGDEVVGGVDQKFMILKHSPSGG